MAAAVGALLIERLVGLLLLASDLLGRLAVGISRASEERAEAAFFQHHRPPAIFAVFPLALFLKIGLDHIRQVHRKLARVGAVGVAGAGNEAAMLTPLDDQRLAALLARQVGGLLHPLDVGHVLFGVLQVMVEFFVKIGHGAPPVEFAFLDF